MYYSSSSKGQITTLACINAAGGTVPPMHVFPGVRFARNPMEGCVEGHTLVNQIMAENYFMIG